MLNNVITAEWLDAFFAKAWGCNDNEEDQLASAFSSAGKTMLATAALKTKDPVRISRFLGLPMPYVSAVIWNLDRDTLWITKAYSELALLLEEHDMHEAEVRGALDEAMEQFWEEDQPAGIDLVSLWSSISWFLEEKSVPDTLEPTGSATLCP
jgi:hypothetical protein